MGLPKQREHDERYDLADEYMEIVYKLWEGSWEDDAVVRDAASAHLRARRQGPHGDPSKAALPP